MDRSQVEREQAKSTCSLSALHKVVFLVQLLTNARCCWWCMLPVPYNVIQFLALSLISVCRRSRPPSCLVRRRCFKPGSHRTRIVASRRVDARQRSRKSNKFDFDTTRRYTTRRDATRRDATRRVRCERGFSSSGKERSATWSVSANYLKKRVGLSLATW